jgi:regulatory protein
MSGRVISVKKGKKHLSEVLFENGTSLMLDSEYCVEQGIFPDTFIDEEQEKKHKNNSDIKRAKSLAMWYLSRADHSEKALRDKLKRAGFNIGAVNTAINRMKELSLIDDEKLAFRLAPLLLSANNSPRQAVEKLVLKGISRDLAKAAVGETENDPKEQIENLLKGQYRNKLSNEKDIERTFNALIRRGFSFSDVKSVMRKITSSLDDCEEF